MTSLRLERPEGEDALTEFVGFRDRVYEERRVRWSSFLPLELPFLAGEGPFAEGRRLRPLLVRDGAAVVARAVAVIDERYNRHWNERLGHVVMFEALPATRAAARLLLDAACAWLEAEGAEAARAGFGVLEMPFVIDDYESLPPSILRHNPAYYHALLKDAGFETERAAVDYKIAVRPELIDRWEGALEAGRRAGVRVVPLRDVPEAERAALSASLTNDAFGAHWGYTPATAAEQALVLRLFESVGVLDTSLFAYLEDEPVGELLAVPETSALAVLRPDAALDDAEKLNFLGIGVREAARGRGVALAMAAHAYLELVRRGARHLSYTLVLDDNWASRRTAERLGAAVCANYVVYRRRLRR